jgi:hypothetical protein
MMNLVIWSFGLAVLPLTIAVVDLMTTALAEWLTPPLKVVGGELNRD